MKPTVVIAYPGFGGDIEVESKVLAAIDANIIHTATIDGAEAQEAMRNADAVMVTIQPVTPAIMEPWQQCKIIARVGTGLDAIDLDYAAHKGVWVTYVPDYSIDEVSAHAVSLLLAQARGIVKLANSTKQGKWDNSVVHVRRLADQTFGVAGCGRIGAATAAKGLGLGMRVIGYDPYIPADVLRAQGIEPVDLPTLLRESDYISLHMPLTPENRTMINAESLAQMKSTAYLINTARGPLIDEGALYDALEAGVIAGAALDVFVTEPPGLENPLVTHPKVIVTPHIGWYSEEAKIDVRQRGAEDVVRVLTGQPPRAPANKVVLNGA